MAEKSKPITAAIMMDVGGSSPAYCLMAAFSSMEDAESAMRKIEGEDPVLTGVAQSALLWILWHHQGASSRVGQSARFALGMGQFERLSDEQIAKAKSWSEIASNPPGAMTPEADATVQEKMFEIIRGTGFVTRGQAWEIVELLCAALASVQLKTGNDHG